MKCAAYAARLNVMLCYKTSCAAFFSTVPSGSTAGVNVARAPSYARYAGLGWGHAAGGCSPLRAWG